MLVVVWAGHWLMWTTMAVWQSTSSVLQCISLKWQNVARRYLQYFLVISCPRCIVHRSLARLCQPLQWWMCLEHWVHMLTRQVFIFYENIFFNVKQKQCIRISFGLSTVYFGILQFTHFSRLNKTVLLLHVLLFKVLPLTTFYVCNSHVIFIYVYMLCILVHLLSRNLHLYYVIVFVFTVYLY